MPSQSLSFQKTGKETNLLLGITGQAETISFSSDYF
jgi:hypothetical protein